jgi:hypothetical protein
LHLVDTRIDQCRPGANTGICPDRSSTYHQHPCTQNNARPDFQSTFTGVKDNSQADTRTGGDRDPAARLCLQDYSRGDRRTLIHNYIATHQNLRVAT